MTAAVPSNATNISTCVFCIDNPLGKSVVEKQLVFTTKYFHVLLEHKPITKWHFIITPIRHTLNRFTLTKRENYDLYEVFKKINNIYQGVFNTNTSIVYEKNGMGIPHFQIHVIPVSNSILSRLWVQIKLILITIPGINLFFRTLKEPQLRAISTEFNKKITLV